MRRNPYPLVALALILAISSLAGIAAQGRKVALVIGNSAYATGPLRNPVNDAADLSAALGEVGFSVAKGSDATKKTMYQLF